MNRLFKKALSSYIEARQTQTAAQCPVCLELSHYRAFKRHLVNSHDWAYITDGEFPEPRSVAEDLIKVADDWLIKGKYDND